MNKSERLNQEMIFLKARNTFNIKDLMGEFGISRRTALRDVQELEALGIPIYVEFGRNGKYHILDYTSFIPVYFTEDEIAAALFAIRSLENMLHTPFDRSYNHIYQKLLATLSQEKKDSIVKYLSHIEYQGVPAVAHPVYLRQLLFAAQMQQVVEIKYGLNGTEKEPVYVYNLFFHDGFWFFNGYDGKKKVWRIYRCDGIISCDVLPEVRFFPSREEAGESLRRYRESREMLSFRCTLTPAGKEHFLRSNYFDITLDEEGDDAGTILMTGRVETGNIDALVDYLVSFGVNIQLLEPKQIIDAYTEKLEGMLKLCRPCSAADGKAVRKRRKNT